MPDTAGQSSLDTTITITTTSAFNTTKESQKQNKNSTNAKN
jgi:hypothetical protein